MAAVAASEGLRPPPGNTVVADTSEPERGVSACFDYWRWVLPLSTSPEEVRDKFAPSSVEVPGRYGYLCGHKQGNVTVYERPRSEDMGTLVEVSGQGCRELEAIHGGSVWKEACNWVADREGWCTRLDFAIDDTGGILDRETIGEKLARDEFTSRTQKWKPEHEYERGVMTSWGYRLGARVSEYHCGFYDKALESGINGHWLRCESRFAKDKATEAMGRFLGADDPSVLFSGFLRDHLQFRERCESDSNKSRWPVSEWWLEFLDRASRARIVCGRPKATIEAKDQWLHKTVSKSLAMVVEANGGDADYLYELLEGGKRRLTDRDRQLVDAYQRTCPEPIPFTGEEDEILTGEKLQKIARLLLG